MTEVDITISYFEKKSSIPATIMAPRSDGLQVCSTLWKGLFIPMVMFFSEPPEGATIQYEISILGFSDFLYTYYYDF